jgi:molecular chaperone HtpG
MEKVLNSMPNADGKIKADKVLEISANHKILDTLKSLFDTDVEKLNKYAIVLYNQARLLEGLPIEDVSEFVLSMTEVM